MLIMYRKIMSMMQMVLEKLMNQRHIYAVYLRCTGQKDSMISFQKSNLQFLVAIP